jgi:hypothetical protein
VCKRGAGILGVRLFSAKNKGQMEKEKYDFDTYTFFFVKQDPNLPDFEVFFCQISTPSSSK